MDRQQEQAPSDGARAAGLSPASTRGHYEGDVAAVTVDRPREELYAFWRSFENLARIFQNVISIKVLDSMRSHWVVRGLSDETPVEWVSVVTQDIQGQRIAWSTERGADIANSGWIEFRDAAPGRGTEVRAYISYEAPLGPIGDLSAKALRKDPGAMARIELRRFKQFMETGEVATSATLTQTAPAARVH